jgi:hypothetical protein
MADENNPDSAHHDRSEKEITNDDRAFGNRIHTICTGKVLGD